MLEVIDEIEESSEESIAQNQSAGDPDSSEEIPELIPADKHAVCNTKRIPDYSDSGDGDEAVIVMDQGVQLDKIDQDGSEQTEYKEEVK